MVTDSTIPSFFVPGTESGGAERAYERLGERARSDTGSPLRQRRIFRVHCRLDGRDRHLEVGQPAEVDGPDITAIFETGTGDRIHVYTGQGTSALRFKSVYLVTEFARSPQA